MVKTQAFTNRAWRFLSASTQGTIANLSKPFSAAPGHLKGGWREADDSETDPEFAPPWHPIAKGVEDFVIEAEEMYGAPLRRTSGRAK